MLYQYTTTMEYTKVQIQVICRLKVNCRKIFGMARPTSRVDIGRLIQEYFVKWGRVCLMLVFLFCVFCVWSWEGHSISLIMPFFLYTIDLPTPSKKHPNQNVSVFGMAKYICQTKWPRNRHFLEEVLVHSTVYTYLYR